MTNQKLRIAFMGTPEFAAIALRRLCNAGHDVVCVYSQPPRPKGRGHKVQKSPVQDYAESQNISVHHPKSLKSAEEQDIFAAYDLDIAIVAAYGLLLPKAVLDAPKHGCINIHASLLPHWRGASPIQRSIWAGDNESGVTLMQMDEGLDTGPEILKRSVPITTQTTASSLHDALADLGGDMALEALETLTHAGSLKSIPQDNSKSTYAPLLTKEDGRINWEQAAIEIDRQIRALNPWPGVYTGDGNTRIKIHAASVVNEETSEKAGTILAKNGYTACGDGTILKLSTIQPAGKKAMDFASALNGGYVKIGGILT